MTRLEPARYLDHLDRESARFRAVLTDANPDAPVPTCPEWTVSDLLWHLTEVQYFWARTVNHRPTAPDPDKGWGTLPRPDTYAGLLAFFDECAASLENALIGSTPDDAAWTWSTEQSVGFILRRQAHEALIHRLDAELVSGQVTALDPVLATDGVHEALDVMFGEQPAWGTFAGTDDHVCVQVRDTDVTIWAQLGHFTGTDPATGEVHDSPDIRVVADPEEEPALVLEGNAGDLDAWLWHRHDGTGLDWAGDADVRERFTAILAQPLD